MSEIIFLGDLALTGLFIHQPELNDQRFAEIRNSFTSRDLIFCNLEVPIKVSEEVNPNKDKIYYSNYSVTKNILEQLNICCVSLANNHIFDCGHDGLFATIDLLDSIGIKFTGAGYHSKHLEPVIIEFGSKKIGFCAYVDISTNTKTENIPGVMINYLNLGVICENITRLKGEVDFIVCSLHWGVDYSNFYTKKQQEIAHAVIDYGADIIMGHHPHTVQPFEKYKEGIIFYSLGGICFGDDFWNGELRALRKKTKLGMMAVLDDQYQLHEIVPTMELEGNFLVIPRIDIRIRIRILRTINTLILENKVLFIVVKFKEIIFDRLMEYFFGYYRNPLKQLNPKNFKNKIKIIMHSVHKLRRD